MDREDGVARVLFARKKGFYLKPFGEKLQLPERLFKFLLDVIA
jgi:hypothetical protein